LLLELGGNAAVLVHEDAGDLGPIAARIAWGAFAYAGQVCIKVQRLVRHAPIYRRLLRNSGLASRPIAARGTVPPRRSSGR
jgi:acyl-CoA reductase-like NAD-dependent aldehyde dehydrogenase